MQSGCPLHLCVRGRPSSLLFPAAWISGKAACGIHDRRHSAGVSDGEGLRSALHGELRTPGKLHGLLALSTDDSVGTSKGGSRRTSADRVIKEDECESGPGIRTVFCFEEELGWGVRIASCVYALGFVRVTLGLGVSTARPNDHADSIPANWNGSSGQQWYGRVAQLAEQLTLNQ